MKRRRIKSDLERFGGCLLLTFCGLAKTFLVIKSVLLKPVYKKSFHKQKSVG